MLFRSRRASASAPLPSVALRILVDEAVPLAEEAFGPFGRVTRVPGRSIGRAEVAAADALVVRSVTRVDEALLGGSPVRFVGTATIGTDHVDAQLGDGLPAELVLGLPGATIADLDRAAAIVLLGPDLKEELPVLHLRVRRAVVDLGVPLLDLSAVDHGLSRLAARTLRHLPGEQASAAREVAAALAPLTEGRSGPIVVVLGRPDVATAADPTVAAAAVLRDLPDARFLLALRRGNVRGALELGLAPGVLPGRVTLEDGSARFTAAWGTDRKSTRLNSSHSSVSRMPSSA